jgi:hypothetical protein
MDIIAITPSGEVVSSLPVVKASAYFGQEQLNSDYVIECYAEDT